MLWHNQKSIAYRMGLLRDQRGIMNRYFRERTGWDKHLARTRGYIERSAAKSSKSKAVVLGSGWLLDVPLDALAQKFEMLWLVDIAHPPQIRHRCKKYPHVELVEADITGGYLDKIYRKWKAEGKRYSLSVNERLTFDDKLFGDAFFISVNVLNQLDILIYDFLEKKVSLSERKKKAFSSHLQEQHLNMLGKHESCLVSDYQTIRLDKSGNELKRGASVFADMGKGQNREEWLWEFDNSMRYDEHARVHFKVMAMEFNMS